jgi:hypothetical protein
MIAERLVRTAQLRLAVVGVAAEVRDCDAGASVGGVIEPYCFPMLFGACRSA